jgi:hypothetical protein
MFTVKEGGKSKNKTPSVGSQSVRNHFYQFAAVSSLSASFNALPMSTKVLSPPNGTLSRKAR